MVNNRAVISVLVYVPKQGERVAQLLLQSQVTDSFPERKTPVRLVRVVVAKI